MDLKGLDIGIFSTLNQIVNHLNHNIIFAAEDFRNFACNPFLENLEVDLLHVNLLIELGRKLCALEELRVHAGRHDVRLFCCLLEMPD